MTQSLVPSTSCTTDLLSDSSFEVSSSAWGASGGASLSRISNGSVAKEGPYYGQISTTGSGQVSQAVTKSLSIGDSYTFSIWMKSDDGTNFSGTLALWGVGGTNEDGATTFTVGPTWTLVSAPLQVQNSGHTSMQPTIYPYTTGRNLDIDGAQLLGAGLQNASFEKGGSWTDSPWYRSSPSTSNAAIYTTNTGYSMEGAGYVEWNDSVANDALGQSIALSPSVGQSYTASIWVRSNDGTPLNGSFFLYGMGGTQEGTGTAFTATSNWQLISAPLDITQSGHSALLFYVYLGTTGHNLDMDGAMVTNACLTNASYEVWTPTGWSTASANFTEYSGSAKEGTRRGQMNVTASGGALYQGKSISIPAGSSWVDGVWLNSADNSTTITGSLCLGTSSGSPNEGNCTGWSVSTNQWKWVTAPLNVVNSGHGSFQMTIYITSPTGNNLNIDGASVAPGTVAGLQPPPAPTSPSAGSIDGGAELSWSAPLTHGGGGALTGYTVTPVLDGTPQTPIDVGNVTSYTVTGLTNGDDYTFRIAATNDTGDGPYTTATATPGVPDAISSVTVTPGVNQATVQWAAPTNAVGVTKYTVTATPESGSASPVTVTTPNPNALVGPLASNVGWNFSVTPTGAGGDGDAATTTSATTPLSNSNVSFQTSGYTDYSLASTGGVSYMAIANGDFRNDGRKDLVVVGSAGVNLMLSNGDGTYQNAVAKDTGRAYVAVAVADLNGDGNLDIAGANGSAGTVSILWGNGDGTFDSTPTVLSVTGASNVLSIATGDLDQDGQIDFAVGADSGVVPFINAGSESFTQGSTLPYVDAGGGFGTPHPNSIVVGNIDGDVYPDIVVGSIENFWSNEYSGIDLFLNDGSGGFGTGQYSSMGNTYSSWPKVTLEDVNGDGLLDVVSVNGSCNYYKGNFGKIKVLLNNGSGGFDSVSSGYGPQCENDIASADLNGDGAIDFVGVTNSGDHDAVVSLGYGDGSFVTASNELPTGGTFNAIATVDVNGDGLPDVVASTGSTLRVIKNTSASQWAPEGWLNGFGSFGGGFWCGPCALKAREGGVLGQAGDPVDTATGNFTETYSDFNIPGRGQPLSFTHTYNSQAGAIDGPLGYGFSMGYGDSLSVDGTTGVVTYVAGTGAQIDFTPVGSTGDYTAPTHVQAALTKSGSTYTLKQYGSLTLSFNSSGQLTQEEDLNGYTTTLAYSSGKLSTITDNAGRELSLTWTGSHITEVDDDNVSGNSRSVSFSYDSSGNLTDVTDVNGGNTHFGYDTGKPWQHLITTVRDPRGNTTTNHYDSLNRVDWQKDNNNKETDFSYDFDTNGNATVLVTDPVSTETFETFQYGLRTSVTRGYGTSDAATTTTKYDPQSLNPISDTDANGNTTTYSYDLQGNLTRTVDPLGRVTTATYNDLHEPLTQTDGNGVTTTDTYDSSGNLTSVSTPLGGTGQTQETDYTYGDGTYPGDVTQVTDPNGKSTYFHYDGNGYRDQVKDPLGHVTGTVRNDDGWITASYSPKAGCTWNSSPPTGCSSTYETTYDYDAPGTSTVNEFGLVGTVTDPLSHTTEYTYDEDGNTASVTDGDSNETDYVYDADNRLTETDRPDSTTLTTDYNDDGTVHDRKDGKGNALITYGYDSLGRVISTTDANSNETAYTLDGVGNVLTKLDPVSGATCGGTPVGCTSYTYDDANQLKTVSYSDSSSENVTSITYDDDGQRTAMTDGTGSSSWSYDSLHRLTGYTNGNGDTVSYGYTYGGGPSYDLKNQVRSIVYPNSVGTVTQGWNDDGTLASVTDWNSKQTTFSYDDNGNQTGQTVPSTTNVTDTFGFNAADRMTSVSDSNGSTLFSANYTRDGNGQLASDDSQASNQSAYKYTALNQLCYAGSSSSSACTSPPGSSYPYAFDNADNLTTNNGTTQQYDTADQLCWTYAGSSSNNCATPPSGATTFSYNNQGDRTASVPSAGSATCFGYDQANLLTSIKTGTGSSCTTPTTVGTYAYDGDGLRESKTVSGTTTQFSWDGAGGNLLQQNDGTTTTSFIYGPGGLPVEQIAGSTTTYLHHDQIGSTRLLTDAAGATGTATTITFNPYGNVVSTSGSLTSPFGYTGVYTDTESGLLAATHRYYDPTTATWLTVDPLLSSTMQPYAYVAGNPVNAADPAGLGAECALLLEDPLNAGICQGLESAAPWVARGVIAVGSGVLGWLLGSHQSGSVASGNGPTSAIIGGAGFGPSGAGLLSCASSSSASIVLSSGWRPPAPAPNVRTMLGGMSADQIPSLGSGGGRSKPPKAPRVLWGMLALGVGGSVGAYLVGGSNEEAPTVELTPTPTPTPTPTSR